MVDLSSKHQHLASLFGKNPCPMTDLCNDMEFPSLRRVLGCLCFDEVWRFSKQLQDLLGRKRWQTQEGDLCFISPALRLCPSFDPVPSLILQVNVYVMPPGTHYPWRFWYLIISKDKCAPCSRYSKEILQTWNLKRNKRTNKLPYCSLKIERLPNFRPSPSQNLKTVFSILGSGASLSPRTKPVLTSSSQSCLVAVPQETIAYVSYKGLGFFSNWVLASSETVSYMSIHLYDFPGTLIGLVWVLA